MTDTELLERIANTLERIEIVLEEKQNRTLEAKESRQLMQDIVKYYGDIQPPINVEIGRRLHIYGFRDAISKIKNIKNTKFETRRINKSIRQLEEHQFVSKINADMFQVLDTGKPWEEYE